MSIHFISGKPGGGKTLYSVKLIVDELVYGVRVVVTNVPLDLARLNEYLQEKYPRKTINLHERIITFSEERMKGFFTIRPFPSLGPSLLSKQEWEQGKKPDYSSITDNGVFYVIDEVHIGFNARAWMDTGRDVLYYLSQHRKLGDTVICITQAVMNVDKQFRSVTQDYTYMRNLAKERMGFFGLPSLFIRQLYNEPATGPASTPMETATMRLDVTGLASCYNTAVGVGIHGRAGADTGEKKKGLHWSIFVFGIIVLTYCIAFLIPNMVAKVFDRPLPMRPLHKPSVLPTNQVPSQVSATITNNVISLAAQSIVSTNQLKVTGVDRLTGRWRVYLNDSTVIYEGDEYLESITPAGVGYAGVLIPFAKPTPTVSTYTAPPPLLPTDDLHTFAGRRPRVINGKPWTYK